MSTPKHRPSYVAPILGPLQTKIVNFLKTNSGWRNAKDIAAAIGAEPPAVYKCLYSSQMGYVKRREALVKHTKYLKNTLLTEYSLPPTYTHNAEQAISLSRKHPGMFGQLHWAHAG